MAEGNNPEFMQDGVVTPKGIEELKRAMPFADFNDFEKDPRMTEFSNLFTVKMITNYIQDKLARGGR